MNIYESCSTYKTFVHITSNVPYIFEKILDALYATAVTFGNNARQEAHQVP